MKEVIALERGIWQDRRREKDSVFSVDDDAVATWFRDVVPTEVIPEKKAAGPEPEMNYGQLGQKSANLADVLAKKGPGRPEKEEGRKMDVIT